MDNNTLKVETAAHTRVADLPSLQ